MSRGVVLACVVAVIAALAVEAVAEDRFGADRRTGFGFELNGAALTVRVAPGKAADEARKQVFGEVVVAVCFASYDYFEPRSRVVRRMLWPAGHDTLTFTFDRDISVEAKSCLIEDDGGSDFAVVGFGPKPALLIVRTDHSDGRARGVRSFMRLRDTRGRSVSPAPRQDLGWVVEPGRYRLSRYDRRCLGSCQTLGPSIRRCTRRILLRSGLTRLAVVHVDSRSNSCRIRVRSIPGARASIARTIRMAVRSAVDGNYARACRFGTRAGRRRLVTGYNLSSRPDLPNCEAVLRREVEESMDVVRRLRRGGVVISNLRVRGGTARARVAEGKGPFAGSGRVTLRRVQGRWRIDNSNLIPYGD